MKPGFCGLPFPLGYQSLGGGGAAAAAPQPWDLGYPCLRGGFCILCIFLTAPGALRVYNNAPRVRGTLKRGPAPGWEPWPVTWRPPVSTHCALGPVVSHPDTSPEGRPLPPCTDVETKALRRRTGHTQLERGLLWGVLSGLSAQGPIQDPTLTGCATLGRPSPDSAQLPPGEMRGLAPRQLLAVCASPSPGRVSPRQELPGLVRPSYRGGN